MPEIFEVRDARVEGQLRDIGRMLHESMVPGYGFALLIFQLGPGGASFYISDALREDMVLALEEFLDRQRKAAG